MLSKLGAALAKGALQEVFAFIVKVYELFRGYFVPSVDEQKRIIDEKITKEYEKLDKGSRPKHGGS
jgi:hypothetical protein